MSDRTKGTHLKRETFKNLALKPKLSSYGDWLKDKPFKIQSAAVHICVDKEAEEQLTPVVEELYGKNPKLEFQILRIVKRTQVGSSKLASLIPVGITSAPCRCGYSLEDLAELVVGDKVDFEGFIWVEAGIDLILARAI